MKTIREGIVVATLLAAALLYVFAVSPPAAEAGGPYFSSLYVSIKSVITGYQTISDSLRVGKLTTLHTNLTVGALISDSASFLGNAIVDTVTITGASATDKYIATCDGAATADTISLLLIQPTATGFIAHRTTATAEGNQAYNWWRVK